MMFSSCFLQQEWTKKVLLEHLLVWRSVERTYLYVVNHAAAPSIFHNFRRTILGIYEMLFWHNEDCITGSF